MKKIVLSAFAKITLTAVIAITIFSCVLTTFVKISEKSLSQATSAAYAAKPINGVYSTDLEGGYWELASIEDTLRQKPTKVSFKEPNSSYGLLSGLGASFGYSYSDGKLASYWPMSDASYVMNSWDMPWYDEYMILQILVPKLKKANKKLARGSYSDSYAEFCKVIGSPLPCIAMTGYREFFYGGDVYSNGKEIAPGLIIESVGEKEMVLAKDNMRLVYNRVKSLPYKIAPISIYYQEQILYHR